MIRHKKHLTLHIILCVAAFAAVAIILTYASDGNTVDEAAGTVEITTAESAAPPLEAPSAKLVATAPALPPEPEAVERYAGVTMTDDELRDFAAVIYLEAGNQSAEGQQAVAEVVLNRVIADNFPDTVHDVLHQGVGTAIPQFSTIGRAAATEPRQEQFDAITAALYGISILPNDVVFFSGMGENSRVWGTIEDHVFCYQYVWD